MHLRVYSHHFHLNRLLGLPGLLLKVNQGDASDVVLCCLGVAPKSTEISIVNYWLLHLLELLAG